jgi:hypothetical protein
MDPNHNQASDALGCRGGAKVSGRERSGVVRLCWRKVGIGPLLWEAESELFDATNYNWRFGLRQANGDRVIQQD